ncbi:hypothetical protein [Desulfacinum hydrothermale]|uniref:hypothetical protein n=1 Tax=Desulfacinum hydrothermale TaxID=109258 RepID=UPI001FE42AA6|nr:hypothetical protein [Desulfacinum hydrothermale]
MGGVALRIVAANVQAVSGLATDVLEPRPLPPSAYLGDRRQYDASRIIAHMAGWSELNSHARIIGLVSVDLCVPILQFVFGEAQMGGRLALVSGARLRTNPDGSEVPLDRYYERLVKVALHELGHTLEIYHCDTPGCLMCFSPSVSHLDRSDIRLCSRCLFLFNRAVHALAHPKEKPL